MGIIIRSIFLFTDYSATQPLLVSSRNYLQTGWMGLYLWRASGGERGGAYNYYTHIHSQKVLDEHIVIYFRQS